MRSLDELADRLRSLDGKGYGAYKQVKGAWDAGSFTLEIEYVQGDPYARPSRLRAVLPPETTALPAWSLSPEPRRRATADFLNRRLAEGLRGCSRNRGSGKSGLLEILRPGQEILVRTSLLVSPEGEVEARLRAGLPARGRRILGRQAAEMLVEDLPRAVEGSLPFPALDAEELRRQVETAEDANALRTSLGERGLVAFLADGAGLPRRSGIDDRPLPDEETVPFEPPEGLKVTLETPNSGPLSGLGIPEGVTLIVGGGYHGKSTLLQAIERGVYDHVPGDGRERVVTVPEAVKIRAEDGRRIEGVDISNFISGLPRGRPTTDFRTDDASGSTSQAAAIAEALEVGATCLLVDEDTSATNFMIRDARMQALIADEDEPITPFIDRARSLHRELGVSTVLVVGGSGDYFDVADTVIAMREYRPRKVTEEARRIASELPTDRRAEAGAWREIRPRIPDPDSLDPSRGKRSVSIKTRSKDRVLFGTEEVELGGVEQIVETAQTRAMAQALVWARRHVLGSSCTLREALDETVEQIAADGLDLITPYRMGELAAFRVFELTAFLNRIRSLEVRQR